MRAVARLAMMICLTSIGGAVGAARTDDAAPTAIDLARLDGFAQGMTQADQFSGVVLVAINGRILFTQAYGKRDERTEDAATVEMRYNLASLGKMFTSVAIWQQIAAGRLTLDTHVGSVLTGYRNRAFADRVTVRQLLTHTAGAGEIDLFGAENAASRAALRTTADIVARYDGRPPVFTPGTSLDYSNYGFVVLGRMVEVLSGEDYESYVRRHIFVPAGMTRTGFVDCTVDAPDIAVGYATVDGKQVRNCATQPTRGMPAGGELSTAGDIYRFVQALQAGTLMPSSLFVGAIRPYRMFMGLGFFATDYGPGHSARDFRWGHGGSSDGACTEVRTYPATGETIVTLANRDPPSCFAVAKFLHAQARLAR